MKALNFSLLSIILLGLSSCLYKMPEEDDIRKVPRTNHPELIKDNSPMMAPGIDY